MKHTAMLHFSKYTRRQSHGYAEVYSYTLDKVRLSFYSF
jgi:hypothetical protein